MNPQLTRDAFDALEEISHARPNDKPSPCVGRNAKHLIGVKLVTQRRKGSFELTEKGTEVLFTHHCVVGLRAVASGGEAPLAPAVTNFLMRKGYVTAAEPGHFDITDRGRECLADIDLSEQSK